MIDLKKSKEILGKTSLSDSEVQELQGTLYALVENIVDEYISSSANIEPICKNQLSIAESPLSDKKQKDMDLIVKNIAVRS